MNDEKRWVAMCIWSMVLGLGAWYLGWMMGSLDGYGKGKIAVNQELGARVDESIRQSGVLIKRNDEVIRKNAEEMDTLRRWYGPSGFKKFDASEQFAPGGN